MSGGANTQQARRTQEGPLAVAHKIANKPVLVVEDDPDCREMLATLVEALGYPVVVAQNGAEALAVAHAYQPCLILLDLMMPVMDGEEFRQTQLADPAIRDIPVIIVSAKHSARATAKRLRAAAAIAKPIDLDEVSAKVAAACAPPL